MTLKTRAEEIWHGAALDVLRHEFCTSTEDNPCQQRPYDRIADANPSGTEAVFPAKLSGIAHKDYSREIRSAKSESREPRTDSPAAEHKAINRLGLFARKDSHEDHQSHKENGKKDFDEHLINSFVD